MSQFPLTYRCGGHDREDVPVAHQLFAHTYDKLCRLAATIRRSGASPDLDATALVHEAYLHLQPCDDVDVASEKHFLRLAARAMRQVLVRNARRWQAQKRGGDSATVSLHHLSLGHEPSFPDVLAMKQALDVLERVHPRQVRVVKCRHYDGLSVAETAQALGVSTATVKRDWRAARVWLRAHLAPSL